MNELWGDVMGYCAAQQPGGKRKSDIPFVHIDSPLFQQFEIAMPAGVAG
jgi:hypothetical protein